jgi:hypothetical protein
VYIFDLKRANIVIELIIAVTKKFMYSIQFEMYVL